MTTEEYDLRTHNLNLEHEVLDLQYDNDVLFQENEDLHNEADSLLEIIIAYRVLSDTLYDVLDVLKRDNEDLAKESNLLFLKCSGDVN